MAKEKQNLIFNEDATVTRPRGFLAGAVACGIKESGNMDLALVVSELPCVIAATFTTNKVKAAPVLVNMENLKRRTAKVRAIVCNSGNANACTGERGLRDARRMGSVTARKVGCNPEEVVVNSTGVIGVPMPMKNVVRGIEEAAQLLSLDGGMDAAHAVMTTDTRPKHASVQFKLGSATVTIGGIAKGAGMIHPDMATMLCFLTTDVVASRSVLKRALSNAVERSFNSISVDGDMSTNDTALLLANGLAKNLSITNSSSREYVIFYNALLALCQHFAKAIASDGEGATKFVEINVRGAYTEQEAKRVAMSVANSNLFKTAVFGHDPNWGRIACAVGYASARIVPERLAISLGRMKVVRGGLATKFDEVKASAYLSENDTVAVSIDLGLGTAGWTAWTCDLSYEYVRINAEYTT